MKHLFAICCIILYATALNAQAPNTRNVNNLNRHTDFIGYSTRPLAEARDTLHEQHVIKLSDEKINVKDGIKYYEYHVNLPIAMMERELILRTQGSRNSHAVYANGKFIGSARDSRVPSEFNLSGILTDGDNTIAVAIIEENDAPEDILPDNRRDIDKIYLMARPRIMIYDCLVSAVPDSSGKNGVLKIDVVMESSYNFEEPVKVGYDVYSPENKLKDYSISDFTIAGNAIDTMSFETTITDVANNFWSCENPAVYSLMIYGRRGMLITEYVQFKIGFGTTTWDKNGIYRNGKKIDIKPVVYNAASGANTTQKDIAALKRNGYNTIYVSYPQPAWFYEICNNIGMYVVDCANINTDPKNGNRTKNGTVSNNPQWLDDYLYRVEAMYYRGKMYPCIIAWSLGGKSGNGYNMYKAYQWLKSTGDSRPVVYSDAEGEWNSDLELPAAGQQ